MFKYRKSFLYLLTIIFVILTIIEMVMYFFTNSNLFGLIYLLLNFFILFLLIPTTFNYKNNYSNVRLSKFIMIIVLGMFSSYLLLYLVNVSMNYIDSSSNYSDSIFLIKNILKPFIYLGFTTLTLREAKVYTKLLNYLKKNNKSAQ